METKLKQVIESMHEQKIDSMIVLKPENVRYLTGFRPTSSSVLILKDEPLLLASKIDNEDASKNSLVNLEVYKKFDDVKNFLDGCVGVENSMTVETYRKLDDFKVVTTDVVETSRAVKTELGNKKYRKSIGNCREIPS